MKKLFFLFITLCFSTMNVFAEGEVPVRKNAELINCQSATTSWVKIDGEVKRIRLIAYSPENGELNKEIDEYACNILKNALILEVEFDSTLPAKDKYNRELVWLYADGELVQNSLISKGYGQVNFVTGEYNYLDSLCNTQAEAVKNKLGVWQYDDIKEAYCDSGIILANKEKEKETNKKENKKYDTKNLWYLVFLNSGILLLLIASISKRRGV